MTKEELQKAIESEMQYLKTKRRDYMETDRIVASSSIAISNLYIALSNLNK